MLVQQELRKELWLVRSESDQRIPGGVTMKKYIHVNQHVIRSNKKT